MAQMVEKQLRNHQSVILDCVARPGRWRGGRRSPLHTPRRCASSSASAPTSDVHRSRVVGRIRGIPGWNELDWKFVAMSRTSYQPLDVDKIVLDAVDPLDANLDACAGVCRSG